MAAIAGGVAWVVDSGLLLTATPESGVNDALFVVAALCTIGGVAGFHALQKDDYGRIGWDGFWTVVAATLFLSVGLIMSLLGSTVLERLELFPVGTLAVFIGFGLYGAATLQARVLPRWCGVGLIVGPFMFLIGNFGGILFGLLWLALGYTLWSQGDTPIGQSPRVN